MRYFLLLFQWLLLLVGYSVFFNQWVRPNTFAYLNLVPISFPILFIINLILLLFWWVYRWKFGLLFTILSLGLLFPINKTFHLYGRPETIACNLKIMSYNVHYFDDNINGIKSLFNDESPDVLFMQETGNDYKNVLNSLQYDEMHYEIPNSTLIASRYPIIQSDEVTVTGYHTSFIYADIAIPQDTIRFINFYLESLHIDQDQVKTAEVNDELKFLARNLAQKIMTTSKTHQFLIDSLLHKVTNTSHPIIMGGDMNSVPNSYEYYALSNGLKDPFLTSGSGLGTTFPSFGYPLRLDYIFVPTEFKTKIYRTIPVPYSDHYPVIVELEIP